MRLLEWVFTDPLAQLTLLASVTGAVFLFLIVRKMMTRGRSPRNSLLLYTALALLAFATPSAYFWHQIIQRSLPGGPLMNSKPTAVMKTTSGRDVSLEALRGHVVLLDFWASWCAPCRMSSPAVAKMQKEYGPDLVTIGINVDETEAEWRKALTGPRPAYDVFDEGQNLRWKFRVGPLPQFVVINREGAVDAIETGWEPEAVDRLNASVQRNLRSH